MDRGVFPPTAPCSRPPRESCYGLDITAGSAWLPDRAGCGQALDELGARVPEIVVSWRRVTYDGGPPVSSWRSCGHGSR